MTPGELEEDWALLQRETRGYDPRPAEKLDFGSWLSPSIPTVYERLLEEGGQAGHEHVCDQMDCTEVWACEKQDCFKRGRYSIRHGVARTVIRCARCRHDAGVTSSANPQGITYRYPEGTGCPITTAFRQGPASITFSPTSGTIAGLYWIAV
jgi:hypothetical protein